MWWALPQWAPLAHEHEVTLTTIEHHAHREEAACPSVKINPGHRPAIQNITDGKFC